MELWLQDCKNLEVIELPGKNARSGHAEGVDKFPVVLQSLLTSRRGLLALALLEVGESIGAVGGVCTKDMSRRHDRLSRSLARRSTRYSPRKYRHHKPFGVDLEHSPKLGAEL